MTATYSCDPCIIDGCISCTSTTVCLACQSNMTLSSDQKTCTCIDGYKWDASSLTCLRCTVPFCKSCPTDVLTCASCFVGTLSSSNTCSCNPTLNYFDSHGISCILCHYSCLTCDGFSSNSCLTCDIATRYYSSSAKTCTCNDGTLDDYASQKCQKCHFSCTKCIGLTEYDCIACDTATNLRQINSLVTGSTGIF